MAINLSKKIRHGFAWYLTAHVWLLTKLPFRWQLAFGRWLGRITQRVAPKTKKITAINLQRCFPELSASQQQHLLTKTFESAGMGMIETAYTWWHTNQQLHQPFELKNKALLEAARKTGRGVLLLCPHMASALLIGRLGLRDGIDFSVAYNKQRHPVIEKIHGGAIRRYYPNAFHRGQLKGIIRFLRNGGALFYTPDMDPHQHGGVFAPFFNINAYSLTATSKIVQATNAIVIPAGLYRLPGKQGYQGVLHEPLSHYPSGDYQKDATIINASIEKIIRLYPEQYFWQYKRFKTRPAGEPAFYPGC